MKAHPVLVILLFFWSVGQLSAQDSLQIRTQKVPAGNFADLPYEPLAPSKAAFYSAVLPGLGQAYNESYWKIPVVYAGLGTSVYFFVTNNREYHKYRDAYKSRLAGYTDDPFQGRLSDAGLIEAQKRFRRNKELSIFAAVIIYVLNIVDANVDAHLRQFNVSENLSMQPDYIPGQKGNGNIGLSVNFKF